MKYKKIPIPIYDRVAPAGTGFELSDNFNYKSTDDGETKYFTVTVVESNPDIFEPVPEPKTDWTDEEMIEFWNTNTNLAGTGILNLEYPKEHILQLLELFKQRKGIK